MKKSRVLQNLNPLFLYGIAHRGYHNTEATENGLKAFANAVKNNLPLELDVHLTKDGQLIVCHDENLKRTTGKEGIIEHLTVKEIKDEYKLLDGGEVPTFQEVLALVDEKVPMVVELKVFEKNYKPLAARLKEELKNVKDKKNFMLISFDPRSLVPFKHSGYIRSLLVTESHKWTFHLRFLFESLDMDQEMFKYRAVRNYHKRHLMNCWTIENEEQLNKVLPYIDTVTFQHFDHKIVNRKLKEKNK